MKSRICLPHLGLVCVSVLALGPAPGCSSMAGTRSQEGLPRIGLQRGARTSSLTVQPPYLWGPHFGLMLKNRALTGWVSGELARPGTMRVQIDEEGAAGFGPLGPVSLDFETVDGSSRVEGLWNGSWARLQVERDALHASFAVNTAAHSQAGRADLDVMAPPAEDASCQYVLDEACAESCLAGISICTGIPQQTRLAISPGAFTRLSTPELLTVLVAVLAAPPLAQAEAHPFPLDVIEADRDRDLFR